MNRSSYKGQYDQIVEPEMIAFHADFGPTTTRVVVEFVDLHSDQGSQTKVVLTQVGFPTQDIFNGVSQGTHEAFDKLDSLLARIALAALVGFVAYFVVGFATFGLLPSLRSEFLKYQTVYRSQEAMKSVMPVGMAFMFFAIVPLAILYAMLCQGVSGFAEGARLGALFGALIGVFAIGSFVVHNYVNPQIGLKLTVQQAVADFRSASGRGKSPVAIRAARCHRQLPNCDRLGAPRATVPHASQSRRAGQGRPIIDPS